jgi:diadenosine tetraphosphatase ApaH/serine/threonine PP2A family protein phosphatase
MTDISDTTIHDLGALDGPVLLFGGPYGNLHALDALLDAAARLRIPSGRTICTGDLAAYAADPEGVAGRLRAAGTPIVMGNVEESLGFAADDCHCGFADGSACSVLAAHWYRYAEKAVSPGTKAWMRSLPRRIDFTLGDARFAVIHGGVSEINRFVFPATPRDVTAGELDMAGTDAVVGGHSGLPFNESIGGRLWHNPGVIGLPANDGTPRVWYSLLTPERDGIAIEIRALAYDHAAAAAAIRAVDLPGAYADALETGLWPSDDVMPEGDRARRGTALAPSRIVWQPGKRVAAAAE